MLAVDDNSLFIIYGYGDNDKAILYIQQDQAGKIRWTKQKAVASEFTKEEADKMIADAKKKGLRTFATKVA